jgi:hypothetical protein
MLLVAGEVDHKPARFVCRAEGNGGIHHWVVGVAQTALGLCADVERMSATHLGQCYHLPFSAVHASLPASQLQATQVHALAELAAAAGV